MELPGYLLETGWGLPTNWTLWPSINWCYLCMLAWFGGKKHLLCCFDLISGRGTLTSFSERERNVYRLAFKSLRSLGLSLWDLISIGTKFLFFSKYCSICLINWVVLGRCCGFWLRHYLIILLQDYETRWGKENPCFMRMVKYLLICYPLSMVWPVSIS